MKRLIYVSSAIADLGAAELTGILESARAQNRANGVTGVLLYHDGTFIQVLEGRAQDVDATFARILRAGQHDGVLVLSQSEVPDRLFDGWHMAFARPDRFVTAGEDAVMPFRNLLKDLHDLEGRDLRVAVLLRTYLAGFRDLGPQG